MTEKTAQKEPGKKPAPSKKPKPQQEVVVQISLSELHPFPENRYKRQGALAGFGFCAIGFYKNFFSIQPNRCDRVADFNTPYLFLFYCFLS